MDKEKIQWEIDRNRWLMSDYQNSKLDKKTKDYYINKLKLKEKKLVKAIINI